jgi:uncharacterized membrane protein
MDPTLLLLRWAHILAAIVAMGGLFFARFAVLPALSQLDETTRESIHDRLRRSWLPWVIGAITVLLASGLANFLLFNARVKAEGWADGAWMKQTSYHALFGVKFLMALVAFYLASALVGRGEGTRWVREDRAKWLAVTLGLTTGVVLLSGWMRQLHTGPNVVAGGESGVRIDDGGGRPGEGVDTGEGGDRYRDGNAGWRFRQRGEGSPETPAGAPAGEPASPGTEPAPATSPATPAVPPATAVPPGVPTVPPAVPSTPAPTN